MDNSAPRRRDASRNREAILDALVTATAAGEVVSVEEVAARAGVGVATLYRHFPNREVLLGAGLARALLTELLPKMKELEAAGGAAMDARSAFVEAAQVLVDLVHRYSLPGSVGSGLPALLDPSTVELLTPLADLLRMGQEGGEIRTDIDLEDALWFTHALAAGFATPAATPQVRQRSLLLFFDALRPQSDSRLPARENGPSQTL